MTTRTLAFNLVLFVIEGFLLQALARRISFARIISALAIAAVSAGALALTLGRDQFDVARLLGWTLFLHGPLLLIGFARLTSRRMAVACAVLAAVLAMTMFYAYAIEPRVLEVTHVQVRSSKVDRRVRIAVVADIQTDHVGAYERRALRTLMGQRPDLILFAGDYIQARASQDGPQAEALRALFAQERVSAPLGVFAVKGNVDGPPWPRAFANLGFSASDRTTTASTGPVTVTALSEVDSFDLDLVVPAARGLHVVVGHSPDFALGDVRADLLVAGHTHGGQVRLPFLGAVMNASHLPRSWAGGGAHRLSGGRTLVVSRGVGMERGNAPRLRLLCRPEISIVDVVPG